MLPVQSPFPGPGQARPPGTPAVLSVPQPGLLCVPSKAQLRLLICRQSWCCRLPSTPPGFPPACPHGFGAPPHTQASAEFPDVTSVWCATVSDKENLIVVVHMHVSPVCVCPRQRLPSCPSSHSHPWPPTALTHTFPPPPTPPPARCPLGPMLSLLAEVATWLDVSEGCSFLTLVPPFPAHGAGCSFSRGSLTPSCSRGSFSQLWSRRPPSVNTLSHVSWQKDLLLP